MSIEDELQKEEFVQNYLQYRWLDDTRSKLIDRFFIVIMAVLAARMQFSDFFIKTKYWAFGTYVFLIIFSSLMAKSIVSFRRQQRGHKQYFHAIRSKILETKSNNDKIFSDYKQYLEGKRVLLTRWIELSVIMIAILSPLLVRADLLVRAQAGTIINFLTSYLIITILIGLIIYFVGIPFYKYNYKVPLDWSKD